MVVLWASLFFKVVLAARSVFSPAIPTPKVRAPGILPTSKSLTVAETNSAASHPRMAKVLVSANSLNIIGILPLSMAPSHSKLPPPPRPKNSTLSITFSLPLPSFKIIYCPLRTFSSSAILIRLSYSNSLTLCARA